MSERRNDNDRDRGRDRDGDDGEKGERGERFGRRRPRPAVDAIFDYKDIETLRPFLNESGKIVPSRVSRLNAHQQRLLTAAVKRARVLAMLPFADSHRIR